MTRTPLDQGKATSDVILRTFDNSYNYEGRILANQTAAEQKITSVAGYPVKLVGSNWEIIDGDTVDDENNTVGILVEALGVTLAATTGVSTRKFLALVRGPATLKEEGLVTDDPSGTAYNMTQIKTQLAAFSPLVILQDQSSNLNLGPLNVDTGYPQ